MYLKRLELHGFKTFAQKTILRFFQGENGHGGLTAVVGPNGSGKSNVADAIRWVMGEQSLKLLRGKKSEDVIFSGTDKRARSGLAEVTLVLENTDKPEIPLSEIVITRRLDRDGHSEYELNGQPARLQDVSLLLAQCGIAQRSYAVIGQGMVDAVLVASPSERKEFFDEAFGLRPFQMKRQSSAHKLTESSRHLTQTTAIVQEIQPRLQTLERQAKRLQERSQIEASLEELEMAYYGSEWYRITAALKKAQTQVDTLRAAEQTLEQEIRFKQTEFAEMERAIPANTDGLMQWQEQLAELTKEQNALREQQAALETRRAVAHATATMRAERPFSPLPLSKIIERLEHLQRELQLLAKTISQLDAEEGRQRLHMLERHTTELLAQLQRPAPEPVIAPTVDPSVEEAYIQVRRSLEETIRKSEAIQQEMRAWQTQEQQKRAHVFERQRALSAAQDERHRLERQRMDAAIELTRVEGRRDQFLAEMRQFAPRYEERLDALSREQGGQLFADALTRIQKLRSQLEWIGGIDVNVLQEYEETRERHTFLSNQTADLQRSIEDLQAVIRELDQTIRERSNVAFNLLNHEFSRYARQLFGGGEARLEQVHPETTDEEGNPIEEVDPYAIDGIEIQVTPPGKRLKSISLLSGGERALTSIALICAIMSTNPSPFVVLDEVDAALDEANARKFGEILGTLAHKTQFIVVTHNRMTMTHANALYGVTMGDDGVSQILSVKMREEDGNKKPST